MDSTVLSSNIVYPNDVLLIYKAFGKMRIFARRYKLPLWWDQSHTKSQWRAFGRAKKGERAAYLTEFYTLFVPALESFRTLIEALEAPESQKEKAQNLLSLLSLLKDQTQQKLRQHHALGCLCVIKRDAHSQLDFGATFSMCLDMNADIQYDRKSADTK